ncbi:hypothetical protein [Nannocystis pusilla]|uniref:hypothetical protein n=1 Tax=Nannocystis pusilla TaxID=889268 RepID=UPI003B77561C
MSDISLEKFTEEIRAKVGADAGLKATIKFVFSDSQVLYIDGESTPIRSTTPTARPSARSRSRSKTSPSWRRRSSTRRPRS